MFHLTRSANPFDFAGFKQGLSGSDDAQLTQQPESFDPSKTQI